MKSNDLSLNELVDFADGRLSLQGRRLVIHDIRAFADLRRDLLDMVGYVQARRMLTRFGYYWGQGDASAMKRIFEWDNLEEWIKAGPRLHTLQGVVRAVVQDLRMDGHGSFSMDVVWHDSGEAEEHLVELGKSTFPVCWMLAGYASGYASFCLNKDIYFIEKQCIGKGDVVCRAIGKDSASWGDEIKPHLPFFQSDDVRGKILDLTKTLRQQNRELKKERQRVRLLEGARKAPWIEVHSEAFRKVVDLASRVARYDTSVLITGESGTGKEVLARYLHENSPRAAGPFVAVNCGALPETLLEGELFGHKAGAFTGAVRDRAGLFEEGQKGTVFLDEIGDVSPAMQVKLLRVIQEREILRVGENRPRKVDVRILAATNRDLTEAMNNGTFREDLYYRLRVVEIRVPPLRERREDIVHLVRFFVEKLSRKFKLPGLRLDSTCIDYLLNYSWPGNIRELQNAIEHAAVISKDGLILPEYLPAGVVHPPAVRAGADTSPFRRLAEVNDDHLHMVLDLVGGNKTKAAKILGISQATLWRKLKKKESSTAED